MKLFNSCFRNYIAMACFQPINELNFQILSNLDYMTYGNVLFKFLWLVGLYTYIDDGHSIPYIMTRN